MSESGEFTVLLGSTANDPSTVASGKAIAAASIADMKAARSDVLPASLDHLNIVLNANDLGLYDPMELASWAVCLQDGSTVTVSVLGDSNANVDAIHSSFLLAGLKGVSERREADGSRIFTASRPSSTAKSSSSGAKALPKRAAISVSLDLEDDLIDEDVLLTGDSLAPPPAMEATAATGDDCGGRTGTSWDDSVVSLFVANLP
jgi:hypothetical protein